MVRFPKHTLVSTKGEKGASSKRLTNVLHLHRVQREASQLLVLAKVSRDQVVLTDLALLEISYQSGYSFAGENASL